MRRTLLAICVCVVLVASACAQTPTIEGKKIVGGHGHAMVNTHQLKTYIEEMRRAPLDGILVGFNRNEYAGDEKWREVMARNWFRDSALTIDDMSIALKELESTDLGHFKHNMLWCTGSRRFPGDWFDDEIWEKIILNNARVFAEVYKRGNFEACWFDVEVGGEPGGGVMTWKGTHREKLHPFDAYAAKARQRGREVMEVFTSVVPDFKLVISHAYGGAKKLLNGRGAEGLSEINYGLLPAFVDGLLEGCGESGQIIESGEATYGTMTYPAFMAWRKWERLSAEELCQVPQLLDEHYGYAMGLWPDFRSDSGEWHQDDIGSNHFSPERMAHAFHNAMAASDEFVWTFHIRAHWWPNRAMTPSFDRLWRPTVPENKNVMPKEYCDALTMAKQPMSLDWHPEATDETGADTPPFDRDKAFAELGDDYETIDAHSEGWVFHPADSSTPSAFGWGIPLYTFGDQIMEVYDWRPIEIGDAWENQGVALDGTGVYRRRFQLPETAKNQRVFLAVGGVAGKATVYIARKGVRPTSVGRSEGQALVRFDITEAVDFDGDNDLSIVVHSPKGPGGIFGDVRLLAADKGKDGYAELRGKKQGEWFQWVRDRRLGNLDLLSPENTVEARVRIPDEAPLTAQVYCATEDGGWTLSLDPKGVKFRDMYLQTDATQWHTYRVVTAREGERYVQTLFVDGESKTRSNVDPVKPEKPRDPAIGIGIGWGAEGTHPIKMDVDYLRWANRPFTPEDEQNAARNAPEAQKRVETFWDGAYEGDRMPDAEGWKWWYHHDPRPFTRIAYFKDAVDLSDPSTLAPLYDWKTRKGATFVPRDIPRLDFPDEVHGRVRPGAIDVAGHAFAATLTLLSSKETGWGWPAVALIDFDVPDWSPYAAFGIAIHNPTNKTERLGLCVRDTDANRWQSLESFAPGETITLGARLDDLRANLLPSDVASITLFSVGPDTAQTFLVSPLYLVK